MKHLSLYDNVALRPVTISIVSKHRMSNVGAVNTYLMRPPRLDLYPKERCLTAKLLDDLEVSRRRSARAVSLPKKEPTGMNCSNGNVDSTTLLSECPSYEGKILLLRVMVGELPLEAAPPGLRTGEDHHAARVLVETVHDSRQFDALSLVQRDAASPEPLQSVSRPPSLVQ